MNLYSDNLLFPKINGRHVKKIVIGIKNSIIAKFKGNFKK